MHDFLLSLFVPCAITAAAAGILVAARINPVDGSARSLDQAEAEITRRFADMLILAGIEHNAMPEVMR